MVVTKFSIACEQCGAVQNGTELLALHLRDNHGMTSSQAISLAKEMRARRSEADERVRRAGPALLALLAESQPHICSFLCPSVWKTGKDQPHGELCTAIRAAIASARGES